MSVAFMYVCVPPVCLIPVSAKQELQIPELDLQIHVSSHVGAIS